VKTVAWRGENSQKQIAERLQTKYRMDTQTRHKNISKYFDMVYPEELEAILNTLVRGFHIRYPIKLVMAMTPS
jgi:hypothetical protein